MEGPKPIKIYNSKNEFIFSKGKKGIKYNKSSKIFQILENIFPGNESYDVYAILGLIEAKNNNYIVCANQTTFVGKILDARVYKIEKFCYIPESGSNENNLEDQPFVKMLDDFLERNPLYYSDKIDLTISILNMRKKIDTIPKSHIFKYTVSQYCWNYSMAKCFDSEGMNEYIYPVINGFFGARAILEYGEENDLHFILIGRKDDRRSGMRFLIRGADDNGNVANTVETEVTFEELSYNLTNGYDVTVSAVYTYGESNKSNYVFFYVSGKGNVTGYVYEQDGVTPIAGATVVFEGEDVYGLIVGDQFTTDEEGAFLGSLPVGQYTGYANKEGYQQAVCQQFLVYYNDTISGVDFVMNEVYNPVASVTVTPGDDAATVEWSFNDRSFQFNRVYRAGAYSNDKELLADSLYNTTSYNDGIWAELPIGSYKYGVSSVYEGNAGGSRGIEEVIIGEPASTNGYIPTHNLYNYSCTNQIYTGEEIGGAGTIYSIAFMPTTVNATSRNVNIYMVNTAKTSFFGSTDWVPVTDADLVFSGTAYWTLNEWSTITLDTPFNFDGTNLCLVVNDITGSWVSTNQYSVFDATAQALRIFQDASSYNPASPGTGALLNVKNYIKLVIEQSDPVGNESPIVWSEPVDKDMYTTLNFNVTLNSGESPAGAEIAFINYNENEQELYPVEPVVVDETGVYTWDSFRKGDYFVTITKEGYETFEYNCSIYRVSIHSL